MKILNIKNGNSKILFIINLLIVVKISPNRKEFFNLKKNLAIEPFCGGEFFFIKKL